MAYYNLPPWFQQMFGNGPEAMQRYEYFLTQNTGRGGLAGQTGGVMTPEQYDAWLNTEGQSGGPLGSMSGDEPSDQGPGPDDGSITVEEQPPQNQAPVYLRADWRQRQMGAPQVPSNPHITDASIANMTPEQASYYGVSDRYDALQGGGGGGFQGRGGGGPRDGRPGGRGIGFRGDHGSGIGGGFMGPGGFEEWRGLTPEEKQARMQRWRNANGNIGHGRPDTPGGNGVTPGADGGPGARPFSGPTAGGFGYSAGRPPGVGGQRPGLSTEMRPSPPAVQPPERSSFGQRVMDQRQASGSTRPFMRRERRQINHGLPPTGMV